MKDSFVIALAMGLLVPGSMLAQNRVQPKAQQERATKAALSISVVNEKEQIHRGDSMLVTYRLRSSMPLNGIRMTQAPTLKGAAGWREITAYYPRQRQVTEDGKVYYQLDIAHFVVAPTAVGMLTVSEATFEAEVITGQEQVEDPFDFFGGFFGGGNVRYVTEKQTVKAPKHILRVGEPPLRSTQEILKRGGQLL